MDLEKKISDRQVLLTIVGGLSFAALALFYHLVLYESMLFEEKNKAASYVDIIVIVCLVLVWAIFYMTLPDLKSRIKPFLLYYLLIPTIAYFFMARELLAGALLFINYKTASPNEVLHLKGIISEININKKSYKKPHSGPNYETITVLTLAEKQKYMLETTLNYTHNYVEGDTMNLVLQVGGLGLIFKANHQE